MLPDDMANDVAHDGLMNAVLIGDGLLGHLRVQPSDVPHVLLVQFGAAVCCAERMTFLGYFIV
jgi:hypothetical protein